MQGILLNAHHRQKVICLSQTYLLEENIWEQFCYSGHCNSITTVCANVQRLVCLIAKNV